MRIRHLWTLAFMAALATSQACNCGGSSGGDGGSDGGDDGGVVVPTCPAGLQSIALSPADSTVHISGSGTTGVQLGATGTLSGGGSQDLTSVLAWTVSRTDDSAPGTITQQGLFTSAPATGGVVTVTASCQGVSGSTTVTVILDGVTYGSGDGGMPDDYAGTPIVRDPTRSPVIIYPSDQTRFPRNIYKVLFQWVKKGNDKFRITFAGPFSTTQVYTDGKDPQCAAAAATAGCWESSLAAWTAIAGSNAGHPVTVTIDGILTGDARVFQSAPITIAFSRRDVRGAIFYWSTTAAGIRRANVSDAVPEPYEVAKPVPTALDDGSLVKCVACHTVSRSGKRIIAYTETSTTKGEFTYDVRPTPPPGVLVTTQIGTARAFGTFSPDDARVVATVGNLMAEFDAVTGVKSGNLPVAAGTNPDWSPTGQLLAYSDRGGDSPGSANLSLLTRTGDGGWANPQVLVPAAGLTNLFPSFTHDGEYVAYARGKGGHGDKTLQLFLAKTDGGTPMELVTANRVVSSALTNGQFENNMPTWAPAGDLEWVAFNSLRPYGVVLPGGGTQQIWVAAVDRARMVPGTNPLDGGIDPSYPAFRFAFQYLNEDNHRAFWTLDVRYDQPDGGSCRPQNSGCDAVNTCCSGLECQLASEISYLCGLPQPDAGACITSGATCSQTTGASCCTGLSCDNPDGGPLTCQAASSCPGIGTSCTSGTTCCSGLFCVDGASMPCTTTGCSCQVVIN